MGRAVRPGGNLPVSKEQIEALRPSPDVAYRDGTYCPTPAWAEWTRKVCELRNMEAICGRPNRFYQPCTKPPSRGGNGACRRHGGNMVAGRQAPNWENGRASFVMRTLPERLRPAFEAAVQDDDLLSLRPDLALVDARQIELLEGLSEAGNPLQVIARASDTLTFLASAVQAGDDEKIQSYLQQIQSTLASVAGVRSTWSELLELADQRRRLTEAEGKRIERAQSYLHARDVNVLVARLIDVVMQAATAEVPMPYRRGFLQAVVLGFRPLLPQDELKG